MKILYLCSWYRDDPSGFSGVFFGEQAAVFAQREHQVALACCNVLSLKKLQRPYFSVSRNEVLAHQTRSTVYRGGVLALPRKLRKMWPRQITNGFANFLKKIFLDFGKPDLVHIQSALYAGIYSYQWLKSQGIPYVITEHATFYRRGMVKPWTVPMIHGCFANAHQSIAVSSSLQQDLVQAGVNSHIQVIPNMYDSQIFTCNITKKSTDSFVFLLVCGLGKKKGVELAVEAIARIKEDLPNTRLAIAGDGPERMRLEQQVNELGLSSKVVFYGRCSRETVAKLMAESHCLLSTSYFETFGVTLIEGLASGLPVIATRSGGPEDFIKAPYGELVPTGNVCELAAAMKRMIQSYDYNESAFQERHLYAKRNFSGDALYSALSPVYEKAVLRNREADRGDSL